MKRFLKVLSLIVVLTLGTMLFSCQNANKVDENVKSNESNVAVSNEATEDKKIDIKEQKGLEVINISAFRDVDKSTYIEIMFSKELSDSFEPSSYVKIEPSVSFVASKVNNKIILRGEYDTKQKYKVTVLSGVKGIDDTTLGMDETQEVAFDQQMPKIMFTNEGIILPSVNEKKIYIRSLNVKKVNVSVKKVYVNNTTQFLQDFNFSGNGKYYGSFTKEDAENENDFYYYDDYYSNNFYDVGDELYNTNFDIENEIDTWVQSAIDLSGILDANGFYLVNVRFNDKGTSYNFKYDENGELEWKDYSYISNNGNITKTILHTDMGIMAEKSDKGIRANVLDIIENRPIRGAKVYLMSKNNQILEEKNTDADGIVDFGNHKNSFYILADNVQSKSILSLKNSLNTSGFAVDGAYVSNGINGYIYTERGVYRPGDTVYVSIIARNSGAELKNGQPVKINVYDPTGVKIIENDVINNGKNGFYTYDFKTDISGRTGICKIEATIGNEVFSKDISVETVVPNRIRVNLGIGDEVNYDEGINDWSINANYLFGEPAAGLEYSVNFDIREEAINFEKYKDYTFKTPSSYGFSAIRYVDGVLDKDGKSDISPDFENINFGSINMMMDVTGRVIDDGGRNAVSKKYVKLKKYDTYIGIENTNLYRKPGDKLGLKVICVTSDGENLVGGKNLTYRIYSNDHYWWWDYYDYDDFVRSFKSDKNTTLKEEGTIQTLDTPVLLENIIPSDEYIYVEIEDPETNQIAGVNLQSSEWVDPTITKKVETLNLSSDKKKYTVGDVAKIKYKGVDAGKAIITIEKSGTIINQYIKDVVAGDVVEEINISKDMAPNIYVYVSLLQDYKTKLNDRPLRLYGVIPLMVEDEDTKIDLEIEAPDNIRPNEKFTVKIKNKKSEQVDFTIAVVDEGLLDITGFKTPSPYDYFFQKIASKLLFYDNYSEVIDRPYGAVHQILKVGGDEALLDEMARRRRLRELGLEEADRFTPVSMFKGVLTTDANGSATVDFDMPNYMGQVRIMVVAAKGGSYGSVDKDMLVKAPIIVEPTLPRSLKIGDKISIPVSVFAIDENVSDVNVYYTFKGKTVDKNLTMKKGDKEIVYFEEEVGDKIGSENITVGVKSNVYNYEETVGISINSSNSPVVVSENKELKGKETATFTQDIEYVSGTVDSVLTLSNAMILGLDNRLNYLIRYPYGCAEQTTSSIFPQIFIEKLSTAKDYDKAEVVENINAGISRLKLFQLSNGAFSYWPGAREKSDYATNYVGHFLIYAKKNGYYLPESMYDNWLNYLKKSVREMKVVDGHDIDLKCYSLYLLALAENQNVSEMNYMYENHFDKMSNTSKMYLAAAYKMSGEDTVARNIAADINLATIKSDFERIYERDKYYYNVSFGSLLREIAVYLNCYFEIYGKADEEAFNEIVDTLRSTNWYSTQETAYSLLALSNISSKNAVDTIKGVVEIDGVRTEYSTDSLKKIMLNENAKTIKVIPENEGMTYINYFWEGTPVNAEVESYSEGFSLSRHYYNVDGKAYDISNVKSGDTFFLEVVAKPLRKNMDNIENIAINQILPSGFEIENLRVTDTRFPQWIEEKTRDTNCTYTDIRDDRVMWFFNYDGYHEYRFYVKLNAVTKGEYTMPGTTLEAMYDSAFRAYKKGNKVRVK